jgi:drug/metabolite transporter (DMT)-like permease
VLFLGHHVSRHSRGTRRLAATAARGKPLLVERSFNSRLRLLARLDNAPRRRPLVAFIPSGLAALFITVSPFWMVGMERAVPGGEPVHPKAWIGMWIGFAGAVWLIAPEALDRGFDGASVKGFLILQLSCLGWSLGSILQKRRRDGLHPVLVGAVQQFAVGITATLLCFLCGGVEFHLSTRVLGAILYLALFGSIVAYSSFLYALQHLPVSVVSIYTYVNPVVAVTLGWIFYQESFGMNELASMCVIFSGVYLVKKLSL